ncbi:MAG: septal ring lytic transglycosylase RlpA family protein [Pseudomonadota bacterium]
MSLWKRTFSIAGLITLITAGCAETELAVHTAKQLDKASQPDVQGYYKVGKPYQIDGKWYYPKENFSYRESGIASWYGPGFHGKITANGELYDQHDLTAAHRTLPMPSVVRVTNLENGRSIVVRVNDRGPFAKNRIIDLSKRGAELLDFHQAGTAKVLVEILPNESHQAAFLIQGQSTASVGDASTPSAVPVVEVTSQELRPIGGNDGSSPAVSAGQPQNPQVASRSNSPSDDANGTISNIGGDQATVSLSVDRPATPLVTQSAVQPSDIFVQVGAFAQLHNAERQKARLSGLAPTRIVESLVGQNRYFRVYLGPLSDVGEADRMVALLESNGIQDARIIVD